ncbi:Alpha-lactalbumin [Tupaia chinensis]|uniref:Alpha-lactalbumin n=2 Tax=Tupaia chinensis TaxID=246437 RepID=L8Y944_TUPCH|nr:Alpha-lactalbumin [Tupaia chinensis]
MLFVPLLLVGTLFPAIQATWLTKCELHKRLKDIFGYKDITAAEWICTIFHTSGFDTQAKVSNNGSTEYGLFQISNKHWCKSEQIPQSKNICNIPCEKLLNDDLTDDIACAKKILDRKGMGYWLAYEALCSEQLEQWLCKDL